MTTPPISHAGIRDIPKSQTLSETKFQEPSEVSGREGRAQQDEGDEVESLKNTYRYLPFFRGELSDRSQIFGLSGGN